MTDTLLSLVAPGASIRAPGDESPRNAERLVETADALARALRGAGIERGDRVALVLPNGPEFVELLLAVTALGAAAAPLNPAYTTDEYAFYLDDLAPRALVVPAGGADAARQAAGAGMLVVDADLGDGGVALSVEGRALAAGGEYEPAAADDIALLLHTSGTTSRPKQVPLLHRNLVASTRAITATYSLGPGDVSFSVMPLFHVHGLLASVFAQLNGGGAVLAPRRLAPAAFWKSVAADGVTWFSGSPTLLTMLLDGRPDEAPAHALRFVRSCSAALSGDLFERLEAELSAPVLQAYGMTEASHQIASNPLPPQRRDAQSVGLPTGTEIVTLDEHGRVLPPGTPGEVALRGDGVTPGYLNNPEANAEAFAGGWFRTGDRGAVDADGYLTLEGRIKELIIRGGENISPYEVEDALRRHPAVLDAACFAVPDAKYGEVVGAAVVVASPTDAKELLAFCGRSLAPFKVPRVLHFVDSLPKTATGKVQRQKLAEELL